MLRHTRVVLISEPHYFSKYRDSIHDILILQHDVDLLPEFMSLLLFNEGVIQAHVDEASNVCHCLQMHHLPGQCIYLVWSSVSDTNLWRIVPRPQPSFNSVWKIM